MIDDGFEEIGEVLPDRSDAGRAKDDDFTSGEGLFESPHGGDTEAGFGDGIRRGDEQRLALDAETGVGGSLGGLKSLGHGGFLAGSFLKVTPEG